MDALDGCKPLIKKDLLHKAGCAGSLALGSGGPEQMTYKKVDQLKALSRMAGDKKLPMDTRATLEWALLWAKAGIAEHVAATHPDVVELERLYRLEDRRGH